jgi:hypothetical protein
MGLYPKNLNEYVAGMGIPRGPLSKTYLVDPVNGSDSNSGMSWQAPLLTLTAAEDLCVTNRHDTVLFLAGATADAPALEIAWDKSYTHLIGVGCELPGVGQRCRVVTPAASAHQTITFSGNGCIVKNMQFNNEHATGTAIGIATVSGHRNYFENVFFMCPTSPTAASFSLKVTGTENAFKRCTIGQHTLVRGAASYGLWLEKGDGDCQRNKFIDCEILSWSSVTTHRPINIDADIDVEAFTVFFENLLVSNIVSGAGTIAHAITDGATETHHQIVLRGNCMFLGCGNGIADPVTYTFGGIAAAAAYVGAVAVGH